LQCFTLNNFVQLSVEKAETSGFLVSA